MFLRRKAYDELLEWKNEYGNKYSCLLEGARRVGKSKLTEEFARNEFKSYILVDFSKWDSETKDIFEEDLTNIDMFFLRLQNKTGIKLYKHESAIIFDEIQFYPKARQALKHLAADDRYYFIETVSLISIKKNVEDILIPSEEHKINVYPMDYEEFMWALGRDYSIIKQLLNIGKGLGSTNEKLMRDFRLYMAIGGMPQAVVAYLETNNLETVEKTKQEIISLYLDDLRKIDASGKLSAMYLNIPAQLSLNKPMFSISQATGKRKTNKDGERLYDFIDSKIVLPCYRVNEPVYPLLLTKDFSKYKLYISDTGLLTTLLLNSRGNAVNDIYAKLLSNHLSADLGFLYENAVAQTIASFNLPLYYYTWRKDGSTHNYEIDFLVEANQRVVPIEVKSSSTNNHKSIDEFSKKYSKKIYEKYLLSQKDIKDDGELKYRPIYLTMAILEELLFKK